MSEDLKINFGFFNKEIDEIDVLKVETDIIYDFHLEADKLRLIMNKLNSLPHKFCILCQVKYIMGKNASVRLLFSSLSPNYPDFVYTNLKKQYVNNTEYMLCGTLKQNLLTLTPAFISRLKANRMIGVCFISVKLLLEKITTWMNEKRSFSDVLKTNVLGDRLLQYLSYEDLSKSRLVSKETKQNIDLKRPEIIFEQSKLPKHFDYTQDSFNSLCSRYSKEAKDCALHIIYYIDHVTGDNGKGIIVAKLVDDKGKEIPIAGTLFRESLAQTNIKLSIKFTINNNIYYNESISLLCKIVKHLENNIYSLEIDLRELHLVKRSYVKVDEVLREIPNLRILKLSDGYIKWKPFLSCIKSITTLEELDLSDIRMLTNLFDDSDSDEEEEEEFVENFRNIWSESLKDLKGLRIAGYKSVLSYNEDDQLDLVETVLPCLEHFTQLQSFGCTADRTYGTHMERFIRFLPYLTNITKLDLSGSNLGNYDDPESVGVILGSLPNLKELNLSNCQLEMRFLEIMQLPIQNLRMLRSLDLSKNEDFFPEDIQIIKRLFNNLLLKIDDCVLFY